jgi:uncharacterized MAPEG superfamily protein
MEIIPWISLLVAVALVYAPRWLVVTPAMLKSPGGYDNRNPREQQAKLEGAAKRAQAAHLNAFEAFPPFAAGVLACEFRHVAPDRVAYLCLAFLAARTLYAIFYVANIHQVRSLCWTIGFLCAGALLVLAVGGSG